MSGEHPFLFSPSFCLRSHFDNLILDFTMIDDTIPETTLINSKTNYFINFDILIGDNNERGELSIYYNGSPAEILNYCKISKLFRYCLLCSTKKLILNF